MLILIFLFESTGTIRTKLSKKVPLPSLFSSSEIHHRKERSQDAKKGVGSMLLVEGTGVHGQKKPDLSKVTNFIT
jgi:hypothetical protein